MSDFANFRRQVPNVVIGLDGAPTKECLNLLYCLVSALRAMNAG